jgi:hypothetical protein
VREREKKKKRTRYLGKRERERGEKRNYEKDLVKWGDNE